MSVFGPIWPIPKRATGTAMAQHNKVPPATDRPLIQKLRCTGIAHLRVEVDLFDLKATAMAPGLADHIDEHSQKSADIIAREIAAALVFLDGHGHLLEIGQQQRRER